VIIYGLLGGLDDNTNIKNNMCIVLGKWQEATKNRWRNQQRKTVRKLHKPSKWKGVWPLAAMNMEH